MTKGMARVVASRYQLLRLLGRGGMGAVWHAHDTLLGRDVAIKEIWHPTAGSAPVDPADPFIARALREARAAARLRHPGIITVHDVVTDEGRPWIVMELINGRSLAQAIQDHGLLSERQTAEIGLHVLDALRAAHREGVAHRDVKPANILLDTDRVVLTDFGIAAIDDATALTATGQMVGSPAYLAPERINGLPATAAADLWAVGVTLYAAVTGRSPFQRDDTQATFAAILTSRPTPPAHAGRLWPVIKDLLIKDPARRLTTEQALRLLANVAYPADSPEASTSATGRRRPGWWPAGPRRRKSTPDGMPGTLVAPTWPGADDDRTTGRGAAAAPSGGSPAPAAGGSVKPVASRPAAAPANPSLDSCLVGTWRMTSLQVINHYEGVDARFTSSGGVLTRIWPNGKEIDDYSKSAPLKATIKGARYAEVLRGVETLHVETRKGRVYSSEFSGGRTFKVTRNGKKVHGGEMISPSEDLEYICTETRMTIYGNKKSSTQSFQRLSHQP